MIVLIHTICHFIAEVSIPAWQKEVRNIAHEVVEAIKEAKKIEMMFETMTLCMKYFCSVITNLNLHVEYLITRSIYTRGFNVPVAVVWTKKIDKLLWIDVLHKINYMFRYWYFFCFSVFHRGKCNWRSSLNICLFWFP